MIDTVGDESSNYQYCVFELDQTVTSLNRDQLLFLLRAEQVLARRYFFPGVHRVPPYNSRYPQYSDRLPVTDKLCASLIQMPIGAGVTPELVEKIGDLLDFILNHADEIADRLEKTGVD